jgi:Icc-related predicted phosphoesterase
LELYFCTDIHGSDKMWRKFLSAEKFYGADVLVLGGDVVGKGLVAVHPNHKGYWTDFLGEHLKARPGDELEGLLRRIRTFGMYPVIATDDEVHRWDTDPEIYEAAFETAVTESLHRWRAELARRKTPTTRVIVTCGNDDPRYVDPIFQACGDIVFGENEVSDLGEGFTMLNMGWSNATPWNTHREATEDELAERIELMALTVPDMNRCIFNIHVPPFNSGLDNGPLLDSDLRSAPGQTVPVGSHAVREGILRFQPMLSLHGHVHESRGVTKLGRTICINPGSSYTEGVLQGVLVSLSTAKGLVRYSPVQG